MGYCSRWYVLGIILACCILQFGEIVSPFFARNRLMALLSCLLPLALNLERRLFGPCPYTLFWQKGLLYYAPHIFSWNVAHSSDSPYVKALNFKQIVCTCYIVTLSIAHLKAICVPFIAHSVPFIFQYPTSPKNFCELKILCVIVLCQNNSVHSYRNVRGTL